jgi:MFS family permease
MGVLYQFGTSMGVIYLTNYAIEDVIHVSASQWGLTNTASILVGIIVSIPSARLIDRYGRRKMVLFSLMLTPVALMGFIYSQGFLPAFVFFNLMTALGSVGSVASQALFIDHSPREHRGRITALTSVIGAKQNFTVQMMGGGTIIGAVGNMVGGALYHEGTYALPLYLTAGMIGLTALLAAFFVREPKEREE